jgi:hypothetical protein
MLIKKYSNFFKKIMVLIERKVFIVNLKEDSVYFKIKEGIAVKYLKIHLIHLLLKKKLYELT